MPPKRKSGGKVPHVNIGYVLDQPLAGIAQAINALRERPHPLALIEAKGVAKELPRLMHIVSDAVGTAEAADVVPAVVALALDGLSFSPDVEELGIKSVTNNAAAMRGFVDLFDFTLVRQSVPVDVQIDAAELLNFFSDADATKEAMGERFMEPLAVLVARPQQHFALHREICSNLIALVKCSKANKLRIPCYSPVVQALVTTTDFFLQLQCVELLYRVSRQHPRLLDKVQAELPEMLFDGIRALPNSGDLFDNMCDLVIAWNRTRTPRLVLDFGVKYIDVGDERYTNGTTVLFSPKIFMLMLPNTPANNVSVEYTTIRSIKFRSSDGALCIRLREPPVPIADKLEIGSDGKDCISLKFTDGAAAEFRGSKIRQWIAEMTEAAKNASSSSAAKSVLATTARKSYDVAAGSSDSKARLSATGGSSADAKGVQYHSHNHRVAAATAMVLASQSSQQPGSSSPLNGRPSFDGATPPVADYYPVPVGSNIARPLDMNTPAHPDILDSRYGATGAASAKSNAAPPSVASASKNALAAAVQHMVDLSTVEDGDHVADAPAHDEPVVTAPSVHRDVGASSRGGGTRRPRETADAPPNRDTEHRPPSDKKHCREIEMGSLALDVDPAPRPAPAKAAAAQPTTGLVDVFNMASPEHKQRPSQSRSAAHDSRPASQAASEPGDLAALSRSVLQRPAVDGLDGEGPALDDFMAALQQAAEQRAAALRAEAEASVNKCLSSVQGTVQEGRRAIAGELEGFNNFVGEHVDAMRRAHQSIEAQVDVAVRDLNVHLGDVRDKRRTCIDSIACLESEFGQHSSRSRGHEGEVLRQLKRHVESEISRLARTADEQLRAEPIRALRSASAAPSPMHPFAGSAAPTRQSSTTRPELMLGL